MTQQSLALIIGALNAAGIRYLVVGGLAVNAHGYLRLTVDVDVMIELSPPNVIAGLKTLETLGYRPTVPVTAEEFADAKNRQSWIETKQMKVLKLFSDMHRETVIDVFVSDPIGFETAFQRRHLEPLGADYIPICSYEDLVTLKLQASRPKDLVDLEQLKKARS